MLFLCLKQRQREHFQTNRNVQVSEDMKMRDVSKGMNNTMKQQTNLMSRAKQPQNKAIVSGTREAESGQ